MPWFNDNWDYRFRITVEAQASALSGFTTRYYLSNAPANFWDQVQSDGGDIRVTSGEVTQLPAYVGTIDTTAQTGVLYFASDLSTSDSTFYAYYGNGDATTPAVGSTYGRNNAFPTYTSAWDFSQSGTAIDLTGGGVNFASVGSVTRVADGDGHAWDFPSGDHYGNAGVAYNIGSEDITIGVWTKIPPAVDFGGILGASALRANDRYNISHTAGGEIRFFFSPSDENNAILSPLAYDDNNWHHFVNSVERTTTDGHKGYADGVEVASGTMGTSSVIDDPSWTVGTYNDGNGDPAGGGDFQGQVAFGYMIVGQALSADWVSAEYTNRNNPAAFYSTGSFSPRTGAERISSLIREKNKIPRTGPFPFNNNAEGLDKGVEFQNLRQQASAYSVPTKNALQDLPDVFDDGDSVQVTGTNTAGDGGGDRFIRKSLLSSFDQGVNIQSNTGMGGWLRDWEGKNVQPEWFDALGDGSTDDHVAMQRAIDFATAKGRTLKLSRRYRVTDTLTMFEGSKIEGDIATAFAATHGTEIISDVAGDAPAILVSERTGILKNFTLKGSANCRGIVLADNSFDHYLEGLKVKDCRIGFDVGFSWQYQMAKCRTESGEIGFNITNGTSALLFGCVAYNSTDRGWNVDGTTYMTFSACGTDNAATGLRVNNARGVTFNSFAVEKATVEGIVVSNQNTAATFTAPVFGNHGDTTISLFKFDLDEVGSCTVIDLRLGSAFTPNSPGKVIEVVSGTPVLINPHIFSWVGDVNKCEIIGGNQGRYYRDSPLLRNEWRTIPVELGDVSNTITVTHEKMFIEPDVANRFLDGTPIFDTTNMSDGEIIEIVNKSDFIVGFRTENHTAGTGIQPHPDGNASTVYLWDKASSVRFVKQGSMLYPVWPDKTGQQFASWQGGSTANRPSAPLLYEEYFDTDLGKPLWWFGSDWVDATGTVVT